MASVVISYLPVSTFPLPPLSHHLYPLTCGRYVWLATLLLTNRLRPNYIDVSIQIREDDRTLTEAKEEKSLTDQSRVLSHLRVYRIH